MEHRSENARLEQFVNLLLRWNATINLIARRDEGYVWDRHVADSLQLRDFVGPNVSRAIDLGSGAGFPGLVLAIATGILWELVEADVRKATFLREAARVTAAPVRVHAIRAEELTIAPSELVTARGFAPLADLLPVCYPLLAPGALCVFPRGHDGTRELTATAREWQMRARQVASKTNPTSTILLLSEIKPAGSPSTIRRDHSILRHRDRKSERRGRQNDNDGQPGLGSGGARLPGGRH